MRPDDQLSIYELRTPSEKTRDLLDGCDLKALLGPDLIGYHFEEDFAFLFCSAKMDLRSFLATFPGMELREEHRLRYDEWQDGAGAPPLLLGPLSVIHRDPDLEYPEALFADDFLDFLNRDGNEVYRKSVFPESAPRDPGPYPEPLPPLVMDPGLAFGYGGHPTTKACLSFLLRVMSPQNPNKPQTFLDLGTGTGVLALAALRLGGKEALGVDYSHLARECAANNARLNRLSRKARFAYGRASDYAKTPAELVFSNIPLAVHLDLLEKGAYRDRRYLILSGLLPKEAEVLTARLRDDMVLKELDNHRDDRWSSWLFEVRE
ncbi:MAG: 50S ribosomal protein L11 methyltransferase [Deltaproteobacteria bacterium]|jgi:ribosomal protein L11 methylase PrmA|nr:50S ribosomal protein L11 methyltransferase [Deltaproteobacteria bacterium]